VRVVASKLRAILRRVRPPTALIEARAVSILPLGYNGKVPAG
jgi:hypothetical protein